MAPYQNYNFGIEIESIVRPYGPVIDRSNNTSYNHWFKQLADKLENRNIPAVADNLNPPYNYSKHPEYYSKKWFITRDGSLKHQEASCVAMEIVSPVLNTRTSNITDILSEFWEAMAIHFDVRKAPSCGGHVHVTPPTTNSRFSLSDLKTIAFAIVISEDFVQATLPPVRRNNRYCAMNTRSDCSVKQLVRVGKSSASFASVNAAIKSIGSERDLCQFMQKDRYVLWNFQNTFPHNGRCSGTLEFRGGSQFLTAKGSLRWIAFVVSFITLALEEDLLNANTAVLYVPRSSENFDRKLTSWWNKIRQSAKKLSLSRHLPEDYTKMQ
ncbi:putative amidoligase enzyme [Elaphomyces granulatus]